MITELSLTLYQDIDSAGIGREHNASRTVPQDFTEPGTNHRGISPGRSVVTLSGLLNAIDGNASQEGRLLIMTSNKPDTLDAALTRPGRVDRKVHFGNMSRVAGESIFKRLIGRSALAHDAAFTMEEIEEFARQFAEKVPPNTFSPAQVQNFLQGCRGDPLKALAEIESWVRGNLSSAQSSNDAGTGTTDFVLPDSSPSPVVESVESVDGTD